MCACTHHAAAAQCEGGELFERVTNQGVLTEKAGELLLLCCCVVVTFCHNAAAATPCRFACTGHCQCLG
jgi:hypothetical protein